MKKAPSWVDHARCSEMSAGSKRLRDRRQPLEMRLVQRPRRADRQADAVQRQRVTLADGVEAAMRRAARAHVVFRVDLEKSKLRARFHDRLEMLGLESDADARRAGRPRISTIGVGHARLQGLVARRDGVCVFAGAPRRVTSGGPRHSRFESKYFPRPVTADQTKRRPYESLIQRGSSGRSMVSEHEGRDRGR